MSLLYKYLWADGNLDLMTGFSGGHHFQMLNRMIEDGRLQNEMPHDYVGGEYKEDDFSDNYMLSRTWESGNTPDDDTLAQIIKDKLTQQTRLSFNYEWLARLAAAIIRIMGVTAGDDDWFDRLQTISPGLTAEVNTLDQDAFDELQDLIREAIKLEEEDDKEEADNADLVEILNRTAAMRKQAEWSDIMAKAKRYMDQGRIHVMVNAPDVSVATVYSENSDENTGQQKVYQTEIHRDLANMQKGDPEAWNGITQWSCTCDWGEVSWGRTRQWKKYEGRMCAHALGLTWLAQSTPMTADPMAAGGQQTLPGMTEAVPTPNYTPSPIRQPGVQTPTFQQPGQPSMPAPAVQPPGAGQPPSSGGQVAAPPMPSPEQLDQMQESRPPSHIKDVSELGTVDMPGTFSRFIGWVRESAFKNGDIVRVKDFVDGYDDRGVYYAVKPGLSGEVIWSDDVDTIAIFSVESGPLGAHLVRVEAPTDVFFPSPKDQPFIKRKQ